MGELRLKCSPEKNLRKGTGNIFTTVSTVVPFLESHVIELCGFRFGSVDHAPKVGYVSYGSDVSYVKSISDYFE